MVGQEQWVCNIATLTQDELITKIDELWSQKEHVREDLQARMISVREQARENAVLIKQLLENRYAYRDPSDEGDKAYDTSSESIFSS